MDAASNFRRSFLVAVGRKDGQQWRCPQVYYQDTKLCFSHGNDHTDLSCLLVLEARLSPSDDQKFTSSLFSTIIQQLFDHAHNSSSDRRRLCCARSCNVSIIMRIFGRNYISKPGLAVMISV